MSTTTGFAALPVIVKRSNTDCTLNKLVLLSPVVWLPVGLSL